MTSSYGAVAFSAFLFADTRWATIGALLWWSWLLSPLSHFRFGAGFFRETIFVVSNASLVLLLSFGLVRRLGTVILGAAVYLASNVILASSGMNVVECGGERERRAGVGVGAGVGGRKVEVVGVRNDNLRTRRFVCYTRAAAELILCAAMKGSL